MSSENPVRDKKVLALEHRLNHWDCSWMVSPLKLSIGEANLHFRKMAQISKERVVVVSNKIYPRDSSMGLRSAYAPLN